MAAMRSHDPRKRGWFAGEIRCASKEQRLRRRGVAERGDDVIDHFLDQDAVVALAHHADYRLGTGGANQEPAVAVEPVLAGDDGRLDLVVVERLAAAVAHVLEDL